MKKILPLLLILAACSSNPKNRTLSSDGEFGWIDELDFSETPTQGYVKSSDEFTGREVNEKENALSKESIALLSNAKLENFLDKNSDELIKITTNCYLSQFEKAFELADNLYSKYKGNTAYWNQVGTCYYLNGDYAKAILFYNKSRDLDKKYVPAVNNLGVVYEKQGKHEKALAAYRQASDLNNFAVTPTYNLAQLYLKYGTVGKAFPIFNGLHKRSPNDVDVASALATAHLLRGEYQNALDIYSKMNKSDTSAPEIALNYAVTLKYLGKTQEAREVLNNMGTPLGTILDYSKRVDEFVGN